MPRMSEITMEDLKALTDKQKWELICSGVRDDGESAQVGLLLGSKPVRAAERAMAAAELYRQGRVGVIIPTGGVEWDFRGEKLSESGIMSRILMENGVPEEDIIQESEARTTKENMVYAVLQMVRRMDRIPDSVIIITSVTHMKRSLALARALLPRKIRISGYPSYPAQPPDIWLTDPDNQKHVREGVELFKQLVDAGDVEDFSFRIG